jgi:hypothetical protein
VIPWSAFAPFGPYIENMLGIVYLLVATLQAASVKTDHAQLRTGCYPDSDPVAAVQKGQPLTIRYSLAGAADPCYKVAVEQSGKTVEGYLEGSAIDGVDEFDKGVRDATQLDLAHVLGPFKNSPMPSMSAQGATGVQAVARATEMIEAGQPGKALALLEPQLVLNKNPELMMLAGIASWKNDDPKKALEYWRVSLDSQPNPDLERLYRKVEKEAKSDQSNERIYGLRVLLRYDSSVVNSDDARQMAGALDHEFTRISTELGCHAEERVVAIAQSRDAYRKGTEAAEWSGGQFDGRIRVPVLNGQAMDANMRRTFAHEITHACLSMLGRWPSWLQEGLAQKLSGDVVRPELRQRLTAMAQGHQLPRLANLGQDWSRMDADHASMAYGLSLEAMEMFYQEYANYGIANLLRNPERLAQVTADLDRRLGL